MDRKSWLVLAITFALSWILMKWIVFADGNMRVSYFFCIFLFTWIPGCIGLIAAKLEGIRIPILSEPIPILLLSYFLALFLGIWINYRPGHEAHRFFELLVLYPLGSLIWVINVCGATIFWWGYLYKKLEKLHPLLTMLVIGVSWGLWHAPLILMAEGYYYEKHPLEGIAMMTLLTTAVSPMLFYLRRNGKNIFAPALFFAGLIASEMFSPEFGKNDLIDGVTGLYGIKVLLFFSCIALAFLWKQGALKKASSEV